MSVALHNLIHSLTKSEKRFIKLMGQLQKGDKNYMHLFDAIEKQKIYNEQLIIEQFKDKAFIRQISVAKNYLMNYILRGLRQYHSSFNADVELKNLLIDIEIVFSKGQYDLTERLVAKARKLAEKYDYPLILEEIRTWEEKVNSVLANINIKIPESNLLPIYNNLLEQKKLTRQTYKLAKECDKPTQEYLEKYKMILANPLLESEKEAYSFDAKYAYIRTKIVNYALMDNLKEQEYYSKKLVDLFEKEPYQIAERTLEYVHSLHNLIVYCLAAEDYDLFKTTIEKLKRVKTKSPLVDAAIFQAISSHELGYYMGVKQYKKGARLVAELVPKFNALKMILNTEDKYIFYYNSAYILFFAGDYSGALKWVNLTLNDQTKNFRKDMKAAAMILNILIHYELGNIDMLNNLVKITLYYLKKNKITHRYDTAFINMFNEIPYPDQKKELRAFLRTKLKAMEKIKSRQSIFPGFDYVVWINSKLSGVPAK